jgi:hypothetical protein
VTKKESRQVFIYLGVLLAMKKAPGKRQGFLNVLKWLGVVYFLNTVLPIIQQSVFYSYFMPKQVQSKSIKKKLGNLETSLKTKEPYFLGERWSSYQNPEKRTLGWLIYANNLTESILDPGYPPAFYNLERCMDAGIGDCVQYSMLTYGKFCALADRLSMPEMRNDVRLVQGKKLSMGIWGGHVWLEIKLKGDWVPYEPGSILRMENGEEVVPIVFLESDLLDDPRLYQRRYVFQIGSEGKSHKDVKVIEGLLDYKGFLTTIVNNYRIRRRQDMVK